MVTRSLAIGLIETIIISLLPTTTPSSSQRLLRNILGKHIHIRLVLHIGTMILRVVVFFDLFFEEYIGKH